MGKTTGFLEYKRAEAAYRPIDARIGDYAELYEAHDEAALHLQSARCMDCGVPFCHAGFVVEGLSIGCPLTGLIPEINDLVYRGKPEQAYARLAKTHPFPEITGRVCPALCEGSCTLGEHDEPVTIKNIERYVADEAWRLGLVVPRVPAKRTGRRVAVVGSGPAGLAAANALNQSGETVTVFERADRAGGLLTYGIPGMKLDKGIVQRRVELLEAEGVEFVLATEIGSDYPVLQLVREFDAIVLCAGATAQRALNVPGAALKGVVSAMEYLTGSTKQQLTGTATAINAGGKDVVVVGGGDTGTDCVATAIRQGAKSVSQLEIMPPLPESRAENNPWPLWPKVKKTDYGQQEAAAVFGKDPREYETTVKEVLGDGAGGVRGVSTVRVEWALQGGRMLPKEISGTLQERPAGLIVTAMGFTGPETLLMEQLHLAADARGNVQTGDKSYKSSLPTVFAAGDMRRGPSLVVWSIQEGVRAARECHDYLNNK